MSTTGLGVAWSTLAAERPDLAEAGRALLYQFGVGLAFLGTIRKDGGPRVHPVCPLKQSWCTRSMCFTRCAPSFSPSVAGVRRHRRTGPISRYSSSRSSGAYTPLRLRMVTFSRWTPYGGPAGAGADATLTAAAT